LILFSVLENSQPKHFKKKNFLALTFLQLFICLLCNQLKIYLTNCLTCHFTKMHLHVADVEVLPHVGGDDVAQLLEVGKCQEVR
jgi:hypothetical protein